MTGKVMSLGEEVEEEGVEEMEEEGVEEMEEEGVEWLYKTELNDMKFKIGYTL